MMVIKIVVPSLKVLLYFSRKSKSIPGLHLVQRYFLFIPNKSGLKSDLGTSCYKIEIRNIQQCVKAQAN